MTMPNIPAEKLYDKKVFSGNPARAYNICQDKKAGA